MDGELHPILEAFNPTIVGFLFAMNLYTLIFNRVFHGGHRNE